MTRYDFKNGKCTRTQLDEYDWTHEHYGILTKIYYNDAGIEFRNESENDLPQIALCKELETMGLVYMAHSIFYKCWRLTQDGRNAILSIQESLDQCG